MVDAAEGQPGQLLGALFSASPDAVLVIDSSGTIVVASPAVTTLFGYYPEELIGASISTLLPNHRRTAHTHHVQRFFREPHARQMGAGLELYGRDRDGRDFAVDVSLAPVQARGSVYAAAFVRDASERQRAVDRLRAVNEITQQLLGGSSIEHILPVVAQRARHLSRSDAAWIVLPNEEGDLEIVTADGPGTEELIGIRLSGETSRSAEVMRTRSPEVITDLSNATNVPGPVSVLDLGPGLYVPLAEGERRVGALVFGRVHTSPQFGPVDIAFAELFAGAITSAIELSEARAEVERLGIVAEDERIARDLHDTVIQQLFAIGMSLQATRRRITDEAGERIDTAVDSLDGVIKEIRNTIFQLPLRAGATSGLRQEILRIAERYGEELGFAPRVAFEGPVDSGVPDEVRHHLVQVFGEGLSNIVRHARASSAEAVVALAEGWLTLSLADDGIGLSDGPTAGNGLRNVASRAKELGGETSVRGRAPSGTILEWRVPI